MITFKFVSFLILIRPFRHQFPMYWEILVTWSLSFLGSHTITTSSALHLSWELDSSPEPTTSVCDKVFDLLEFSTCVSAEHLFCWFRILLTSAEMISSWWKFLITLTSVSSLADNSWIKFMVFSSTVLHICQYRGREWDNWYRYSEYKCFPLSVTSCSDPS